MRRSFLISLSMHAVALSLLWADFSFMSKKAPAITPVPLIIDLKDVIVAKKTNLPPKIEKKPTKPKSKPAPKPTSVQSKQTPKPVPVKPVESKPLKNATPVIEKKQPDSPKPLTHKKESKPVPKKTSAQDNLKSLLASVEKIKKPVTTIQPVSEQAVNEGIVDGPTGSLTQPLSIAEHDLIAGKLRSCWNVDAGKNNIEEMIIEVKASVNKDGRVKTVEILNMKDNPIFRSVAESARRAVYICDNLGADSPFQILAEKHKSNYNNWKEIYVRFNPIDGGVY